MAIFLVLSGLALLILVGALFLFAQRANLSLLTLGETAAAAHGLDVRRTRIAIVAGT